MLLSLSVPRGFRSSSSCTRKRSTGWPMWRLHACSHAPEPSFCLCLQCACLSRTSHSLCSTESHCLCCAAPGPARVELHQEEEHRQACLRGPHTCKGSSLEFCISIPLHCAAAGAAGAALQAGAQAALRGAHTRKGPSLKLCISLSLQCAASGAAAAALGGGAQAGLCGAHTCEGSSVPDLHQAPSRPGHQEGARPF